MQMTCEVNTELHGCDVLCWLTGNGEWCDYGVPGSPRWIEVEADEISWPVEVSGVKYANEEALEDAHPGMTQDIYDWAIEEGEWV